MKIIIPILLLALALYQDGCTSNPVEGEKNPEEEKTPDDEEKIDPDPDPELVVYGLESLVAIDPNGKEIGFDYPAPRDRKVGIFYFVWQGAHGYDVGGGDGINIPPPGPTDVNSPYDIHELEKGYSNPQDVPFGPHGAMHYWGKPWLGYYVGNDAWVFRRHAQMLCEAGVDAIFIDVTNGYSYLPGVETLCNVYVDMLNEGSKTPQISFVLNAGPERVVSELLTLYQNSKYDALWYHLNGKPLILAPLDADYTPAAKNIFTIRYAWFDTYGHGDWWGDGLNKWAWGEFSPQRNVKEEIPVMAASHAHLNIGRSFSGEYRGSHFQPENPTPEQTAAGTYFKQQFEWAIQCDPDFIFITGWNEWVAQRQINQGTGTLFLGKAIGIGDTYFVDCYNHEYSRDVEPCANGFRDTYYYYMVDYIRQYKGVKAVEPVERTCDITIDGKFDDWDDCYVGYSDYLGDIGHRNHYGFGYSNISLTNTTGRNDIVYAKVATDISSLFFYVETADKITPYDDDKWMRLFISVRGSRSPNWEGFHWVVNNNVQSETKTTLQSCEGGWNWKDVATIDYAVSGKQMELAIPLSALGIMGISKIGDFTIDFKWVDNAVTDGDICECISDGDSAPGGRFCYRFIFKN